MTVAVAENVVLSSRTESAALTIVVAVAVSVVLSSVTESVALTVVMPAVSFR